MDKTSPKSNYETEPKLMEKSNGLFQDTFEFVRENDIIAHGSCGTIIRRARHKETNEEIAVKCIPLKGLGEKMREAAKNEAMIVKETNHYLFISAR
jgi:hypothetical protein